MPASINKCRALAAKIQQFEDALDQQALGGQTISIQDGPEAVRFSGGSRSHLEQRLDKYKRQFAAGSCAIVLDCDDASTDIKPRRALRPIVSHR